MQRDHMLGWPGLLALIDHEPKPEYRAPERVRVVPAFIADSRTPDSDKPKFAANIAPGCFGVWRKTPPPVGVDLHFRHVSVDWGISQWPGGDWAEGWEWFDASAEAEKPAQATPQPDAEGWIEHDGGLCPEAVVAARKNGLKVLVRFRDGEVDEVRSVSRPGLNTVFKNLPIDKSLDVLAYRVVPA